MKKALENARAFFYCLVLLHVSSSAGGDGGIAGFALEPKSRQVGISIGAGAPLASLRSCHPDDVGKFFSHTL
jgi:hypothetical protein